jgi:hypothetical protein
MIGVTQTLIAESGSVYLRMESLASRVFAYRKSMVGERASNKAGPVKHAVTRL